MNEFKREVWSPIAVRLLKGPIYNEKDGNIKDDAWNLLVQYESKLREYFSVIGLDVVVNESEQYAYLMQIEDARNEGMSDDNPDSQEIKLPRLIRKVPLSYDASLLLVILRDQLEKYDFSLSESEHFILKYGEIKDYMTPFFKDSNDEDKLNKRLYRAITSICNMTYLKTSNFSLSTRQQFEDSDEFEVRSILRDKISSTYLKELLERMVKFSEGGNV